MTDTAEDFTAGLPPLLTEERRQREELWDPAGNKTSELLLTYVKDDFAQEVARSRLIDDRSKTNVTLAAVALPAVALLKPGTITWVYGLPVILTFVSVVVVLFFSAQIIRNRDSDTMSIKWFRGMMSRVYTEQVLYADLLSQIQRQLTDQLARQRELNTLRFAYLEWQSLTLIFVAVCAAWAVMAAFIH